MLTLFHAPQSRSSRIVWLLEELGAPYELRIASIPRMDGSGASDPANPHPDKKVPALLDGGVLVTESAAIVLYLTDRFPAAGLGFPIGDPLRGPYLSWLAYYAGVIEPVVTLDFAGLADHPMVRRSFRGKAEMGERVIAALRSGPYLVGNRFSGADLLLASLAHFARQALPAGDPVDAWLARSTHARPSPARWRRTRADARPAQLSMNDFSRRERLGWRSLRSALASIWRMRSRVTSKS